MNLEETKHQEQTKDLLKTCFKMRENRFFRKTVHQAGSPFALHAIDAAEWLLYFSKYSQMWYKLGFLSKEHIVVL